MVSMGVLRLDDLLADGQSAAERQLYETYPLSRIGPLLLGDLPGCLPRLSQGFIFLALHVVARAGGKSLEVLVGHLDYLNGVDYRDYPRSAHWVPFIVASISASDPHPKVFGPISHL